jgi:hypothetical protein
MSFGQEVVITGSVKYVGQDGWEPDPIILAQTILMHLSLEKQEEEK